MIGKAWQATLRIRSQRQPDGQSVPVAPNVMLHPTVEVWAASFQGRAGGQKRISKNFFVSIQYRA